MNPAYVIAAVQLLILVLLSIDRWVHRVTGAPSMAARLKTVEEIVRQMNSRASEQTSQVNAKVGELEGDVRELRTQIRAMVKAADNLERRVDNRR